MNRTSGNISTCIVLLYDKSLLLTNFVHLLLSPVVNNMLGNGLSRGKKGIGTD